MIANKKKTYSESEYGNLLASYLMLVKDSENPNTEVKRLKNHIEAMEEEAKKLHASYVWVCTRLEELERKLK